MMNNLARGSCCKMRSSTYGSCSPRRTQSWRRISRSCKCTSKRSPSSNQLSRNKPIRNASMCSLCISTSSNWSRATGGSGGSGSTSNPSVLVASLPRGKALASGSSGKRVKLSERSIRGYERSRQRRKRLRSSRNCTKRAERTALAQSRQI